MISRAKKISLHCLEWMLVLVCRSYRLTYDQMVSLLSAVFYRVPAVAAAVGPPAVAAANARRIFTDDIRRFLRPLEESYNQGLLPTEQRLYLETVGWTDDAGNRAGPTWVEAIDHISTEAGQIGGLFTFPSFTANARSILVNDASNHGLRVTTGIQPVLSNWNFPIVSRVSPTMAAATGTRGDRDMDRAEIFSFKNIEEADKTRLNIQLLLLTHVRYRWNGAGRVPAADDFWCGLGVIDNYPYQNPVSSVEYGPVSNRGLTTKKRLFAGDEGLRLAQQVNPDVYGS